MSLRRRCDVSVVHLEVQRRGKIMSLFDVEACDGKYAKFKYLSHLFVGPMNLASVRKDYSLHWHFRNCNHTSEIPKISTRHPQTPNEAIGTLCAKCAIQEVLKKVKMAWCTGSLSCLFSCTNYNGAKHVWIEITYNLKWNLKILETYI